MNERYSVRSIVHVSSFLSGSEFTSHQMHVLESPAPAFLSGQASGICLCAEAEGQGRLVGNLGCASSCPEAQAALCVSGHGQQVCIPVPTGLPGLGEWPESQPHTDLLLTPSKVTQTPPRSADSWATMATRGEAGNNASPCALSPFVSPHRAEDRKGYVGGAPGSDFSWGWKLDLPPYQNCGAWRRRLEPGSQRGLTFSSLSLRQMHWTSRQKGKEGSTQESGSLGLVVLWSRKLSRGWTPWGV